MLVNKLHTHYKIVIVTLLLIVGSSCVEEFNPTLDEASNLLVVDARIIREDSVQTIKLSRSTSIYDIRFVPVTSYDILVRNSMDNEYIFSEVSDGVYTCVIPKEQLEYGMEYKLYLTSPSGEMYESATETILESSPIDDVYYEITSYTSSSQSYDDGAQFYVDLKAPESSSNNYRWTVEETFEYHASFLIAGEWSGSDYEDWLNIDEEPIIHRWDTVLTGGDTTFTDGDWDFYVENQDTTFTPSYVVYFNWYDEIDNSPADTFRYCYRTRDVPEIYTSTTDNLLANEKKKIPINYVPLDTRKLAYNYSIMVKQYALSEDAYVYWNQNQVQSSSSGGLYETQPSQSHSNIVNVNDPDEKVLGYFWASSFSEKRIVLTEKLGVNNSPLCVADTIPTYNFVYGFEDPEPQQYIALIGTVTEQAVGNATQVNALLGKVDQSCVDCRESGGVLERPSFFGRNNE